VKMFFALANAVFDAGIVAWTVSAPTTTCAPSRQCISCSLARRCARAGRIEERGVIDGADWEPYQPGPFVTPPFRIQFRPQHFQRRGAEILKSFTGSDAFGASRLCKRGARRWSPALCRRRRHLSWATFSDAADQAGISRRYGGIHFVQGDLHGRAAVAWSGRSMGEGADVLQRHRESVTVGPHALPPKR